jgi:hypothetical protein
VSAWSKGVSFTAAQQLYDARSAVVHGTISAEKQIEELRTRGAELLRDTLLGLTNARERQRLRSLPDHIIRKVAELAAHR